MADAFRLLRQDIYRCLDEAEFLATKLGERTGDDAHSARCLVKDPTHEFVKIAQRAHDRDTAPTF
jgi:hypothetical protein